MSPMSRTMLHFSVDVGIVRSWEYVFVTGSVPALGLWIPSDAFLLFPDPDSNRQRWRGAVEVGSDAVKFRYFIGYYLHSGKEEDENELIISKWESFLNPRIVLPVTESISGISHLHVNGKFGWSSGRMLVSEASLMGKDQNEILLRFHGNPFKFYKKRYAEHSYCIKVTPFDLRHKEAGSVDDDETEDSQEPVVPSCSVALIAILSSSDPHYREQSPSGDRFKVGSDYFIFRTRSVAVEFLGFRIELFIYDAENGPCQERFATAYALPSSFNGTFGVAGEPLLANSRPIGQIMMEYLFIRPILTPSPVPKLDVSYAKHWKKRQPLEVGHRGMGNSYTKMNAGRENTIHSLNTAASRGADYVEFDVQLSKDKVAVIFHDFHVLVTVAKRRTPCLVTEPHGAASDYHQLAVKDLKLNQLHLLRLEHYKVNQIQSRLKYTALSAEADEQDERLPFPTLVDALKQVDPSVGFNIEVKYPMMQKNGLHECENYFERNDYIDIILSDVLNNADNRRIVFSSFDPDCCAMLAAKQHLYPVLFLCVGLTTRYEPFVDLRASTSDAAVNFAACIDILGVNFHTEDLLRDASPILRARQFGLISFVWGDDLDNKENIDYFKKVIRVDGLIYDRIGEIEARRNVFLVERETKTKLFRQSISPNSSCTVSLDEEPPSPSVSENSASSGSAAFKSVQIHIAGDGMHYENHLNHLAPNSCLHSASYS
ncbi:unnamed protein product [Thelazia callipaeda]|uniref:Glycerophosphocholine phosphodiesterase GPCPD1 n=1 Tax=Thelazia callipaeda TaxID=103827 RepID=A0A158RBV4_THECL|nr:unnamed protein product [Thelazia callipaeda]